MDITRGSRDRESLSAALAATPDLLAAAVAGADDIALDATTPGEWSVRTVLAHLRDDEFMVSRVRLVRMTTEEEPSLAPFDEQRWESTRHHHREAVDELLADFRLQREASLMILRSLEADDWQRLGYQPEIGRFDVHRWVEHWLDHDEMHVAQIRAALSAKGD